LLLSSSNVVIPEITLPIPSIIKGLYPSSNAAFLISMLDAPLVINSLIVSVIDNTSNIPILP